MDPMTASYYRSILFHDSQDQRPLPPTLVLLHSWAFRRFQAMGAGSIISKQAALCVAMTWMSSTKQGHEFTREFTTLGDIFGEQEESAECESESDETNIDWVKLPLDTKVVVQIDDKPTIGEYMGRRSSRIDVRIAGERKSFKRDQVQLAGA